MKFIDKILNSKKLKSLIKKVHQKYNNFFTEIYEKYDLQNELKQGKIFTIILVILCSVPISIFIYLLLSSLLGLDLIFSVFKNGILLLRSVYLYVKWLYTLIKNKGKVIKKYVKKSLNKNNSELEITIDNNQENYDLNLINELMSKIENISSLSLKKEILISLREMTTLLIDKKINQEELLKEFDKKLNEYYEYLKTIEKSYIVDEMSDENIVSYEPLLYEKEICKRLKNT